MICTLEMVRDQDAPHEPDVLLVLEDILADQINSLDLIAEMATPDKAPARLAEVTAGN